MRIKVSITPKANFLYSEIQQYFIHGLIWNLTKGSEFSKYHDLPKFKYFCFSEIFPPTDFKEGEKKYFLISSPDKVFIKFIYSKLKEKEEIKLGQYPFYIETSKPFSLKFKKRWISGSPIVLQVGRNIYWSKKYHSLNLFLKRLKENALKKYNSFYGKELNFEGYIFDKLLLKKQVAIHLRKDKREARIIGTKWIFEKNDYPKELRKFYKFILDCGLGEKNSMGFGFVQYFNRFHFLYHCQRPCQIFLFLLLLKQCLKYNLVFGILPYSLTIFPTFFIFSLLAFAQYQSLTSKLKLTISFGDCYFLLERSFLENAFIKTSHGPGVLGFGFSFGS